MRCLIISSESSEGAPEVGAIEAGVRARGHQLDLCRGMAGVERFLEAHQYGLAIVCGPGELAATESLVASCRRLCGAPGMKRPIILAIVASDGDAAALLDAGADDVTSLPLETRRLASRLAVAERRARELLFLEATSGGPHSSIVLDRALRIVHFTALADARARRMTGRSLTVGQPIAETVDPEQRERFLDGLGKALKGEVIRFEMRSTVGDGERWYEVIYSPIFRDAAEIEGVCIGVLDTNDRHRGAEALAASERRFRGLIDSMQDLILVLDATGKVQYQSPSAVRMTGVPLAEREGTSAFSRIHPDDRPRLQAMFVDALSRPGVAIPFRHRTMNGNGQWMVIDGVATNLLSEPGVNGIVVNARDDTERTAAEAARVSLEKSFRRVFDVSPVAKVITRLDNGQVVNANESYLNLFGESLESLRGRSTGVLFPVDPGEHLLVLEELRHGRMLRGRPSKARGRSGEILDIEAYTTPIEFDGHLCMLTCLVDNTDRTRGEEALRRSEASFRALIEAAPDAILVSRAGRILYANPRALTYLGYGHADELLAQPFLSLLHADERVTVEDRTRVAMEGTTTPAREFRLLRRDGAIVTAEILTFPVTIEGERAVMAFCRDVTERKKVQSQLLFADRMVSVGTLAAGVAHEINNPLAYITANLQHVVETLSDDEQWSHAPARDGVREALADARDGAERVRLIVRDLKTFSRGDEEKRGPVDVTRVLESSISMAWNEIRHRARLSREHGEIPLVEANEARLGQVFLNLLINAAQAIPEGDANRNLIRVSTRLAAGRVEIEIADSGSGIPHDVQRRMFDPFFSTKSIGVGTGLGLSISHGIVTALGGTIEFDTEIGKGTRFRVTLPVSERTPVAARATVISQGRRGRILIVDDEPLVLKSLRRLLATEHDVVSLASAREAASLVGAGEEFDVILCDLMMPDMTGMDLHEEIARIAPTQLERVVFVTGGAFTTRARTFLESVANQRVDKPFDGQRLRELVRSMIH